MEPAVEITVNDRTLSVPARAAILQSLRDQGISIPGLCYHPAVQSSGGCGLCLVEVFVLNGWEIARACQLKPAKGLRLRTDSPKIKKMRAVSARLLLNQGPFKRAGVEPLLRDLIREGSLGEFHDNPQSAKPDSATHGCLCCGLCVRVCSAYGKKCLTFAGRGKDLRIAYVSSRAGTADNPCGKCRACRKVCPVGYIDARPQEVFLHLN